MASGEGNGGQGESARVEVVVESGMEEEVEEDQRVLGQCEQSVHTRLAIAIMTIVEVEDRQKREHGARTAQHLVLEGELALENQKGDRIGNE